MTDFIEEGVGLVKTIVEPLVDNPGDLAITSFEDEDGAIVVEIRCNEADAGKIIGRQGRTIKAIRTLCRAAASRVDRMVEVELID